MNISCKDFNERYKNKDLTLQEEYLKQKFGLQKYHHKRLECLDQDITLDENELKMLKENLELTKKNKEQKKEKNKEEYQQQKEKIYKTNKLKKKIRTDRKEISKICRTKIKQLCKLTDRHKENLFKKKEIYSKKNKKLPQRDLDNLERYDFLKNGIEICRKRNKCDYINLSDIPYDTKFLMNSFKETFITPLFNSLQNNKKLKSIEKPTGNYSKNTFNSQILNAKKKAKDTFQKVLNNPKISEMKKKSKALNKNLKNKAQSTLYKAKKSIKSKKPIKSKRHIKSRKKK